jgi:hypothetical protein
MGSLGIGLHGTSDTLAILQEGKPSHRPSQSHLAEHLSPQPCMSEPPHSKMMDRIVADGDNSNVWFSPNASCSSRGVLQVTIHSQVASQGTEAVHIVDMAMCSLSTST